MVNKLPSEKLAVVGILDPIAGTTQTGTGSSGDHYTDLVDMSDFRSAMFVVSTGAFGTAGNVVVDLIEVATSYASLGTTITGKSATALTEVGSDDDKQVVLNLDASEMTADYDWAGCKITLTCGDCYLHAIGLGLESRFKDAVITTAYGDLDSVDEIVT